MNDVDKYVVEIYKYNIGKIVEGDIIKISEEEIFLCDVLIVGFFC